MLNKNEPARSIDPNMIYNSEVIVAAWGIPVENRKEWYKILDGIVGDRVKKRGHHYILSGQTAFESYPVDDTLPRKRR